MTQERLSGGSAARTDPVIRRLPLAEAAAARREDAVKQLVNRTASTKVINGNRVIELKSEGKDAKGKPKKSTFVNDPVNPEEDNFTVLPDFGTQTRTATGGEAGPVHNQIAQPDRTWDGSATEDNSIYWLTDFNRQHHVGMMFGQGESFKDFYATQSNGRFLVNVDVSNWVTLPYDVARYGHNPVEGDGTSEAGGYWNSVKDTATAGYDAQVKAGKSSAELKTYLAQSDKVDRYDHDQAGLGGALPPPERHARLVRQR
ncbi:MAG: immune inhibitor A domain-containing protein [Ornithinibacter sp.]